MRRTPCPRHRCHRAAPRAIPRPPPSSSTTRSLRCRPTLRPGERVLVELPLKSNTRGLVVPEAAVLYDIHGATWVYEDLGSNAYARRRIEVARHAGDRAVMSRGISEGAKVVTAGAPELFGTEFGAGH